MRLSTPVTLGALAVVLAAPAAAQGAFVRVPVTLPQGVVYESVAPGDYDADGDPDLLVIRTDSAYGTSNAVRPELYRNDGVGPDGGLILARAPFPAPPYPAASPPGAAVSWADHDGDGDLDALVATRSGTALYRNDGGQFVDAGAGLPPYVERSTFYFAEPRSSAWADVDNDGDLDLALPEYVAAYPDTTRLVLYANDGGSLVRTDAAFPESDGDPGLTWGDVDGDGDLDLLYLSAGEPCDDSNPAPVECLLVYDNDGGALAPRPLDFPEIEAGAADLGDFDLDGDLDVLLVAELPNEPFTHSFQAVVYRNDGATFAADTLVFPFAFDDVFDRLTAGQWADYDGDGDVDVLLGGTVAPGNGPGADSGGLVFVFANDGGSFSLAATLPASNLYGTLTWSDFDADGDLDLLTTGDRLENTVGNQWEYVYFARLYRNDAAGQNAAPSPPGGLAAVPTPDGVALSWAGATDDHTPSSALTYNLRVTAADGPDVVSPMSRPGGTRMLPQAGNVGHNTAWTLSGLAPGVYTWTVQAVDNAFNGGPFAAEGTFAVGATATEPVTAGAGLVLGAAPNPSAGSATVTVAVTAASPSVRAEVVDALGRVVAVLHDGPLAAGAHGLRLDGARLPAGVYVVRAVGAGVSASRTLTVVR